MSQSTTVNTLPETSIWFGAISEEDVQLVRRRHAEKVEEWLDFADFATELFALHEKYGIEKGEEGYFAYRKHLRTSYYEKLQNYGPTPDPLDEGCDCIFCRMHSKDEPAEEATGAIRAAKQPNNEGRLGQVSAESPIDFSQPGNQKQPSKKLGPVPAHKKTEEPPEPHPHNQPHATTEFISQIESRLGQVPAEPP
ncbi:MAG: hypothetical protein NXI22_26280, partial [bacterium]|nr:hypothetical protein [bacterium]